ncbi:hypothetical protein D0Z00_000321 [Geotrichum galactomycetum]|uniref:Uncharacterized protein n=1 Tax=Geotrichum galactomycetum TaxID=27317 RepID=A0ACB6VA82_9ASCO|nr:hypothetical protein D0Z00_000321 [Geotrichum candidum]
MFSSDFIRLLRSSHGEKKINANRFYQEYIANKDHIHMNATKWTSLSDFVRYLETSKMCVVEESEKDGLCIAYVDNSPEAIERREYLKRKKEAEEDDNEVANKILSKQIQQANEQAKKNAIEETNEDKEKHNLKRNVDSTEAPIKLAIAPAKKPLAIGLSNKKAPAKIKNVFASSSKVTKTPKAASTLKKPTNMLEKIMLSDQQRKR